MGPLPPLNLSSGPAISEAGYSNGQSTTGAFSYNPPRGWPDVARDVAPLIVGGLVLWLVLRRK